MNAETVSKFRTTEAYISGAICGRIWWPVGEMCGKPFRQNMRGPWGFMDRFSEPVTFSEALDHVLTREGGDFQHARFSADTELVVIRKRITAPGKYELHVKRIAVADIAPDLVDAEACAADFFDDND